MSKIDRRTILRAAPVAIALSVWSSRLSALEIARWRNLAQRTLPHQLSLQAIGQAYRAQAAPEETDRLIVSVTSRLSALTGIASDAEVVHAALRADYAGARTTKIGGWVLSETEIALALLSLEEETA